MLKVTNVTSDLIYNVGTKKMVTLTGIVNGEAKQLGVINYELSHGVAKVNLYQTTAEFQNMGFSEQLFESVIKNAENAGGNIKIFEGSPGFTNLQVLNATQDVSQTPWAKALAKFGYDTVYDFENKVMISTRK